MGWLVWPWFSHACGNFNLIRATRPNLTTGKPRTLLLSMSTGECPQIWLCLCWGLLQVWAPTSWQGETLQYQPQVCSQPPSVSPRTQGSPSTAAQQQTATALRHLKALDNSVCRPQTLWKCQPMSLWMWAKEESRKAFSARNQLCINRALAQVKRVEMRFLKNNSSVVNAAMPTILQTLRWPQLLVSYDRTKNQTEHLFSLARRWI